MTPSFRLRTGVFPGQTPGPVEVFDVIVERAIIGSFYQLAGNRWEFLGPWSDEHRVLEDSTADCLLRDSRTFWLYTDGASRENPASAAIGAVLYDAQGRVVDTLSRNIGPATNNQAEYQAFIEGLDLALQHKVSGLVVRADSQLVVNQVRGTFRVKSAKLKPLHKKAVELLGCFPKTHVEYIPRKYNREADQKANAAFSNAS